MHSVGKTGIVGPCPALLARQSPLSHNPAHGKARTGPARPFPGPTRPSNQLAHGSVAKARANPFLAVLEARLARALPYA
jgi:hypothetical protein